MSTKQAVFDTSVRVLEQAAFLFADKIDSIDSELKSGVSVSFQGNRNGCIELWTVNELAGIIAGNLLGEENDSDDKKMKIRQEDALKEILNMIAGNLITELFGTEPVFNLEIPSVIQGALFPENIPKTATILSVEEYPVVLILKFEDNND